MIIKILCRKHAGAALRYGAREGYWATPDGPAREVIGQLPSGASLKEWEKEFRRVAALRPDIEKNVVHIMISFSEEDKKLGPVRLAAIAMDVQEKLGYSNCPGRWTEHMDGHTQHLHGVVSAVSFVGERIDRTNDHWRGQQISRKTELENGLWRVSSTKGNIVLPPLPVPGEAIPAVVPLSAPGWAEEVDSRVRQVLRPGITLPQLRDELALLGVSLEIKWAKDGSKIGGLGFRFAGKFEVASRVDRGFSLSGLQKQGLDFSAARDIPVLAPPVLGLPVTLVEAKIAAFLSAPTPKIAVALNAPALPPPYLPRVPEVPHVRSKKSIIQTVFAIATQLAAHLWGSAAVPAPTYQSKLPTR